MRIPVALVLVVPFTWAVFGQVESLTGTDRFSHDVVLLDFQGLPSHQSARHQFANWGITFTGENGPVTFDISPPPGVPAPVRRIVSNGIPEDKQTSFPLLIDSNTPLLRIGFTILTHDGALYNPPFTISTRTTVTAFDQYGHPLGSVVYEGERLFAGLESLGSEGISRVTIKSDRGVEGIDDLFLDYFNRPQFTTYLPQLADGSGVRSLITFLNLSDSTAQGSIRLYSPAGESTELGGLNQATAFSLPPRASKMLATSGQDGSLRTAYGVVVSDCPIQVRAVYTTQGSDGKVREAGIVGVETSTRSLGAVLKDIQRSEDTAIALVNPNDAAADVGISLLNEAGQFPDPPFPGIDLHIPAHGQTAMFISELFPLLEGKNFRGSIRILGSPFAVVVIRTLQGFATSSFPSGDY